MPDQSHSLPGELAMADDSGFWEKQLQSIGQGWDRTSDTQRRQISQQRAKLAVVEAALNDFLVDLRQPHTESTEQILKLVERLIKVLKEVIGDEQQ